MFTLILLYLSVLYLRESEFSIQNPRIIQRIFTAPLMRITNFKLNTEYLINLLSNIFLQNSNFLTRTGDKYRSFLLFLYESNLNFLLNNFKWEILLKNLLNFHDFAVVCAKFPALTKKPYFFKITFLCYPWSKSYFFS